MIRVAGRLKGKEVTRELRVDTAPWYQIFGPCIADLLSPDPVRKEFWVVSPDDLSTHKMLARQTGTERREVAGVQVDTFKVHFSPAGALAPFWGADFWYRPSDSAWLLSRLPEKLVFIMSFPQSGLQDAVNAYALPTLTPTSAQGTLTS